MFGFGCPKCGKDRIVEWNMVECFYLLSVNSKGQIEYEPAEVFWDSAEQFNDAIRCLDCDYQSDNIEDFESESDEE